MSVYPARMKRAGRGPCDRQGSSACCLRLDWSLTNPDIESHRIKGEMGIGIDALDASSRESHAREEEGLLRPSPLRILAGSTRNKLGLLLLVLLIAGALATMMLLSMTVSISQVVAIENHPPSLLPESEQRMDAFAMAAAAKNSSLRFDWTDLPPQTPLGRMIEASQSRCLNATAMGESGPLEVIPIKLLRSGMGSSLHTWMYPLCHASSADKILVTGGGGWHWNDRMHCPEIIRKAGEGTDRISSNLGRGPISDRTSPLWCYFGHHESGLRCPPKTIDWASAERAPHFNNWMAYKCKEYNERYGGVKGVYAAATEWLFQNVSSLVVQEAERQIREEAFPFDGNGSITAAGRFGRWPGLPPRESLVTVHFRQGDKKREMELVTAKELVNATISLLTDEERRGESTIHVILVTEDPLAEEKFMAEAPSNFVMHTSGGTAGWSGQGMLIQPSSAGLRSLGALLVAMEADRYVISGGSNWSRLIDELRKSVVNSRCNGCTRVVDLRPIDWA
ncbi:hypothetical protein ACHAWF_010045 [Thalassiosira exigua]